MEMGMKRRRPGFWSACMLSICLLCFGVSPMAVRADVLIELDDGFWEKHYRDCENTYRTYTANSPDGYVILWDSPVSSRQNEVVPNGTTLSGSWHYTDSEGDVWFVVTGGDGRRNGKEGVRGWVRVSDCLVEPDHISFREVYEKEFVSYDPAYDHAFDGVEQMVLWEYPYCDIAKTNRVDAAWFQGNDSPGMYFGSCWRDSTGRMWAFMGYCYGIRNKWICLDDPAGTEFGADQEVLSSGEPVIYPSAEADLGDPVADGRAEAAADEKDGGDDGAKAGVDGSLLRQDAVIYPPADKLPRVKNGVTGLTVAGVAGVVAITAGLMWFFFVKKRDK